MQTEKFKRKDIYVDAVQVTGENMEALASWCGGTVDRDETTSFYIKVPVSNKLNKRQGMAYAGDWILFREPKSFKVFTDSSFRNNFAPVFGELVAMESVVEEDFGGVTVNPPQVF